MKASASATSSRSRAGSSVTSLALPSLKKSKAAVVLRPSDSWRREPLRRRRVALGRLDLDEVRAEAAQQLAGVGGGPALAQLDDAQPPNRQVRHGEVRHQ